MPKTQLSKVVQSREILGELILGIGEAKLMTGLERLKREVKGVVKKSSINSWECSSISCKGKVRWI